MASASGAPPDLTKALTGLEDEIRGAVETLDRLDEFILPNEKPDNAGFAVNM